ncbi:transposase [Phocaeicola barnesiae]|nr:transposase [Phocaeicola barnesiae]MDM8255806.1 transposase [Phocaeicola barnesiae]
MSHIEEHHFEVLKVKHADGRIESMYLPMKDDTQADIYNEIVPGTSITANMLSYLMFNRFQMSTPAYREVKNRLSDRNWNTSPQNLLNWADKGAMQLNKLIPALKKITLQDGANPLLLYMYLDNELMDIEHLCCLAHARAKFKYAFDQRSLQARIFLELIAKLYGMEDTYRREKLTVDEIYRRRNSKETTEIIEKIRTELYDLLANPDESRSELMSKA